jgi:hypothetical protein
MKIGKSDVAFAGHFVSHDQAGGSEWHRTVSISGIFIILECHDFI